MLKAIYELITTALEAIGNLFHLVWNFIVSVYQFVIMIPQYLASLTALTSYLPRFILPFAIGVLFISAFLLIVNRE